MHPQALIDASNIAAELAADGGAALLASEGYAAGQSNVLRMLGYFSLPGLLRVHSLIGDYQTGGAPLAAYLPAFWCNRIHCAVLFAAYGVGACLCQGGMLIQLVNASHNSIN